MTALDVPRGQRAQTTGSPAAPRLHWIDWLRVGAIGAVFVFHSLRAFNTEDWHVKNAETSDFLTAVTAFFWTFGLAVLFLLAGAGARFALRKRSWQQFVGERAMRLLVPFAAGTLLLAPFQALIEGTHKGTFDGSLMQFPRWWIESLRWVPESGFSPSVFGIGYHLWFLGFLFAISVIALPLCGWLMGPRGSQALATVARRVAAVPGSTLVLAVPIWVLLLAGTQMGTDEHDWAELTWYFGYFAAGFVLLADGRFMPAVRRDGPVALVVALGATAALVGLGIAEWLASSSEASTLTWRSALMVGVFALEGWCWTLVVLNIGLRVPALQRPLMPAVGEAVLPVYILHQPVILAVAFFVVQWPLPIVAKVLIVFAIAAPLTLLLVELGLRANLTRVLLGARVRAAPPMPSITPGRAERPRHAEHG